MSSKDSQSRKTIGIEAVSQEDKIIIRESGTFGDRQTEYLPRGHCSYEKTVKKWRDSINDWHVVGGCKVENVSVASKDDRIVIHESGHNRPDRRKVFTEREIGGYSMEEQEWNSDAASWRPCGVRVVRHIDVDVPQYMVGDNR
jgi:hypothetical protein